MSNDFMFDRNGGRILANPVMGQDEAAADAKRLLEERGARRKAAPTDPLAGLAEHYPVPDRYRQP